MTARAAALRAILTAGGAVASTAGMDTMLRGVRSVPGDQRANAAVDSELRYYGAFYAAYGLTLLRVARRHGRHPDAVRGAAGALMLAGLARAGGWAAHGAPHPAQRALLVVELALPPAIVALQRR
ncbi:MAG: DUF4345 domain-containing protein [Thermoleophilaceae bacterium]